jgi:hypothetical protein
MSIAESYRAISTDLRRAAERIQTEDVRRAYLALADLWWKRAMQLDGAPLSARINDSSAAIDVAA